MSAAYSTNTHHTIEELSLSPSQKNKRLIFTISKVLVLTKVECLKLHGFRSPKHDTAGYSDISQPLKGCKKSWWFSAYSADIKGQTITVAILRFPLPAGECENRREEEFYLAFFFQTRLCSLFTFSHLHIQHSAQILHCPSTLLIYNVHIHIHNAQGSRTH